MSEKETIENAYNAMDSALRDPAAVPLYYNPLGYKTGLSVTIADLERLFPQMAKAAHLFRLYEGPAPARDPDGWRKIASECAAVCREASMQYHLLCASAGIVIGGAVRERLDSWDYMAVLFSRWPAFSSRTAAEPSSITEPSSIAAEAASEPVGASTGAGEGKPLYYLTAPQNGLDLACFFAKLVEAGFIDGSAPDAQEGFQRTFDPKAKRQGRIAWIKKGRNRYLNKMAICDFLRLFGITEREDLREYALAIFGETLSKSTLTNCAVGSAERDALRTILDKVAKR